MEEVAGGGEGDWEEKEEEEEELLEGDEEGSASEGRVGRHAASGWP